VGVHIHGKPLALEEPGISHALSKSCRWKRGFLPHQMENALFSEVSRVVTEVCVPAVCRDAAGRLLLSPSLCPQPWQRTSTHQCNTGNFTADTKLLPGGRAI